MLNHLCRQRRSCAMEVGTEILNWTIILYLCIKHVNSEFIIMLIYYTRDYIGQNKKSRC